MSSRGTVVLTGASSGIGAEAAVALGGRGWTVCLLARRAEQLEHVAERIRAAGGRAHTYPVDLTDDAEVAAVVEQLLSDHRRIDVLVNNAGRSIRRGTLDSLDRLHDYERTLAINYLGPVRLTLALLPHWLEQGRGHVVMSTTLSTQLPVPLFSAYLGSKAALESFTRSLEAEHGHRGVSTTLVHFPMVRTPMSGGTAIYAAMPMMTAEKAAGWIVRAVQRRPSRVSSVGGLVTGLAQAAAPRLVTRAITPAIRRMDRRLARRYSRADAPTPGDA